MYLNLYDLLTAKRTQDTAACHLVSSKDIPGTICTVWTYIVASVMVMSGSIYLIVGNRR